MVVVGEALPLAPIIGEGAGALISLLAFGACVGLAYAWRHTFGDALEWIADRIDSLPNPSVFGHHLSPLGPLAHAFRSVDHSIQHNLAAAAAATGHAFHACFNQLAHDTEQLARWADHYSALVASSFVHFQTVVLPRWGRHAFRYTDHVVERAAHRLWRRITRRLREAEHGIRYALRAVAAAAVAAEVALGYAEKWVGRTAKQARAETRRLRRLEELTLGAGAAVLVATALGRLGLRWLRCPSLGRLGRKIGCGGFNLLELIATDAIEAFVVTDLCRFAEGVTAAALEVRPLLMEFVDVEEALIGCHGADRPPVLHLPDLHLPTVNAGLRLT